MDQQVLELVVQQFSVLPVGKWGHLIKDRDLQARKPRQMQADFQSHLVYFRSGDDDC